MRWAGDECGKCYEPKPLLKSPRLYGVGSFVLLLSLCAAVMLTALSQRF